eukprot:scaffold161254_cov32-Tisochrysis_lutea.AAC.1
MPALGEGECSDMHNGSKEGCGRWSWAMLLSLDMPTRGGQRPRNHPVRTCSMLSSYRVYKCYAATTRQ